MNDVMAKSVQVSSVFLAFEEIVGTAVVCEGGEDVFAFSSVISPTKYIVSTLASRVEYVHLDNIHRPRCRNVVYVWFLG